MKRKTDPDSIGGRIAYMLELRNISQRTMSKNIGVNETTISRWIKGDRRPEAEDIIKICREYNVSADWLLGLM